MKHRLWILSSQKIEETAYDGPQHLLAQRNYWLEIKSDSRKEVTDFLSAHDFDPRLTEQIEDPSLSTRVNVFSNALLINLVVTDTADIYRSGYLTLILKSNLLISILSVQSTLFDELIQEAQRNPLEVDINIYHVVYYMIGEILQQGKENMDIARRRVQKLSERVDDQMHDVPLGDIIQYKRDIGQLTNVVEDQYNMLGFVPKLQWTDGSNAVRSEFREQVQGLQHLMNSFNRLEEKVDIIHSHYQLLLQEKGNKRLNTLTVIQAIFVPLTFLAGVYGMNFLFMPELQWHYSYYFIWGLMICITVVQLWWFKSQGWFD